MGEGGGVIHCGSLSAAALQKKGVARAEEWIPASPPSSSTQHLLVHNQSATCRLVHPT